MEKLKRFLKDWVLIPYALFFGICFITVGNVGLAFVVFLAYYIIRLVVIEVLQYKYSNSNTIQQDREEEEYYWLTYNKDNKKK